MLSTVLGIIKGIFAALGWAKQASDQKTGADLQAGADAQATVKEAQDARVIRQQVASQAPNTVADDLDEWVRKPSPKT